MIKQDYASKKKAFKKIKKKESKQTSKSHQKRPIYPIFIALFINNFKLFLSIVNTK